MKKPRNRPKPRRTPSTSRARQEAAPPSESHQLDLLLRLWEDGSFTLSDIADALNLPMPALMKLLRRPDIAELLEEMTNLLELRLRHIAAKAAPRALETLDAVQTETEQAATSTPVSPQAIKADREAKAKRTHRRLAATAILNHHKSLRTILKPAAAARTIHKEPGQTPVPHQHAVAA